MILTSVLNDICSNSGITKTLYIISFALNAIKVLIPVVIIIMGIVAFLKEIFNDKTDMMKPALVLGKKILIGLMIPFVYTIVTLLISYADSTFNENKYPCVFDCLKSVSACANYQKSESSGK